MPIETFVGIDAGGSKTLALLGDDAGRVLARANGPAANLQLHGHDRVVERIVELVARVQQSAASPSPAEAMCVGLAGADRPGEGERVAKALEDLGVASQVQVVHDGEIALRAGLAEAGETLPIQRSIGLVVIAGTGTIAFGVAPDGARARAGGHGYLLGDEGSAYWLGREGLRAVLRQLEGRGEATVLSDLVTEELGVEPPGGLVSWVYRQSEPQRALAALAPLVERAAHLGDHLAHVLIEQASEELYQLADSVARRLRVDAPASQPPTERIVAVTSGGAFRACPTLRSTFEGDLEARGLAGRPVRWHRLEGEPALGALQQAILSSRRHAGRGSLER